MKVKELYKAICEKLQAGNIENAEFEARTLICEVLCFSATDFFLKASDDVSVKEADIIDSFCDRRLNGEPLQYIIGKWDFMGRSYKVGEGVLIPRPETEILCERIIEALKNKKQAVVYDLCSGSGCIGITVKSEYPDSQVFMVEKSNKALEYLMDNASSLLNKTFYAVVKGDVLNVELFEFHPAADIIVSNPPYIRSAEVPLLQKEVTFEPEMALDGGEDGLDFYRYIISNWYKMLKPDGEFFFEIGEEQGEAVCEMLHSIGFCSRIIKDYNNLDRIVTGRKKPYDF